MADKISKKKRSENMSKIRSKDTKIEMTVRKTLFSKGLRYRLYYKIPGKPDLVFPRSKLAVFINGCFWHHHGCKNVRIPKSNTEFWKNKLEINKARDNKNYKKLKRDGWKVVVIWDCDIKNKKTFKNKINKIISLNN